MASLQGNAIKDTYKSLLKVADNGELEATAQEITDGDGNGTGVSLNTSGDVIATGTVSFASLKDTAENITITKFVDEADGIGNNDNDSSIPTSAAVKDYVDTNITAQDLDITDGVNVGAVDLDSQLLTFTGDAGVSATVAGQTVTLDSSALQNQIDSNDGDITTLQAADITLQNNIDGEESARISADTNLQNQINSNDGDISGLDGRLVTAENKLATIETNADVTDVANVTTALNSISVTELNDVTSAGSGAIITTNERNKLAGIEAGAEVNPTASEVKTLYESNADTNAFTDAEQSKLSGIETGAQVNTVDSVNTQTGAVVLDADDIDDSATTNKFTTQGEIDKLAGIESGAQVNTVDSVNGSTGVVVLDADDIDDTSTTNKFVTSTDVTKLSNITITQAVDLDTLESDVSTNTSKLSGIENGADVTDATNVAAAGAMMTDVAVINDLADVSGTPSDGQVLTYDTVNGWQPESAPVTSVNTQTGAVVLDADDIDDSTTTNKFTTQSDIDKLAGIETGAEVNTVDSVNGETGVVVLDADDIDDTSTTNKFTTQSDIDKLAGIEAGAEVNTVDSVNGATGTVVLDADDIDDTSTTNKFTNQTDIDKLAGIEALADVTDATNVAAAGALMDGVAELADLADVAATSPSDGQVLTYDTVNGWQPETPIDGSGTANYVPKWSDSNTLTDSTIYDDSSKIGIGTSTLNYISGSNPTLTLGGSTISGGLIFQRGGVDKGRFYEASDNILIQGQSGVGHIFYVNSTTEAARFNTSGNLAFPNGQGIDFSASEGAGATSSLLDDYEEGTFTPTAEGASTAGTTTYSFQFGHYTKVGRMVNVNMFVGWTAMTGTGNLTIGGLPFTIANLSQGYPIGTVDSNNLNWSAGTQITAQGQINTTTLILALGGDDLAVTVQSCVNEAASLRISMTYFV
jgi:hypothetical protein